jgi:glycosyltransferase involved in cell wall biosynthesis
LPGLKIENFLIERRKWDFKCIIDVDDYWHLPFHHLIYGWWKHHNITALMETMIREMDAVTCTTERLAEKIFPFNKNVHVLPNALFINDFVKLYEEKIRFGYVGGSTHFNDLKTVRGIFHSFPDLDFTLCGYNNPEEGEGKRNVWDSMERLCSNNYKNKNFKRSPTMDLWTYMNHYDKLDVVIAPLEDMNFNYYKSSLKVYEAGAAKCPIICSSVPPFTDDIPDDLVTFCKTSADWKTAIKKHKDIGFVKEKGEKLYDWVKANRNLDLLKEKRIEVYQNVVDGK